MSYGTLRHLRLPLPEAEQLLAEVGVPVGDAEGAQDGVHRVEEDGVDAGDPQQAEDGDQPKGAKGST